MASRGVQSKREETPSTSTAMVVHQKGGDPEHLISDEMGSEVIAIVVGEKDTIFNIHKNLIRATSAFFYDMFRVDPTPGLRFALKEIDVAVFKLFIEFLYTKRVPAVSPSMTPQSQALRTKQLCQLYAFADQFHLNFEIRNKIMDRIQDGFLVMDKFPEPGLVRAIYTNSQPDSKLRHFAMSGVYSWFRSTDDFKNEEFKALLRNNNEVMDNFLEHVRSDSTGQETRVRQCHGWEGCAECAELGHARIDGLGGMFPCEFHIHKGIIARAKDGGARGPVGTNTEDVEVVDEGCYIWTEFPDRAWMEKHILKLA